MTDLRDDRIDPYESRLARRVGAFAEQAVRPFDANAVAAAAHAGTRRATVAGRVFGSSFSRIGLLLAGALVAGVAFGMFINAGGNHLFDPSQTIAGPVSTPTQVPGGPEACAADALSGGITAWDGAAGHRIATVVIQNTTAAACSISAILRPALVDAAGHALIVGPAATASASVTIAAGGSAGTLVDMANYCGTAPTTELALRFYLPSEDSFEATNKTRPRAALDPPPCNGPNVAAEIQMQPLTVGG